ncbi:MAG TPA: hypothetical protein VN909_04235 [Candidatus Dormibacteraeota bacterium]|nr:hypothetical protein [Candidatus Dormibacteraeota bacterium]
MKASSLFAALVAAGSIATAIAGCGGASGPAPSAISQPPLPTNSPAANKLYVDHNGTLYEYALPLAADSKPARTLVEWPGLAVPPQIAVDQFGNVALASSQKIRFFRPPIRSFSPARANLILTLTPAITEIGLSGADLVDIEYDPNLNLWLLNNLGAEISELRAPISKSSVAALTLAFGAPGSKTAGFTTLVQARFDINAALYVYASTTSQPPRSRLWKIGFPYARPPGSLGLSLAQAGFVDSSQWPPTAGSAPSLLLGQYFGQLHSPRPGSPPSPPVNVTAQFPQPFIPSVGRFPDEHLESIVGALIADPNRGSLYTLDAGTGALDAHGLPLASKAAPKVSLPCLAGPSNCSNKIEHLFLAP